MSDDPTVFTISSPNGGVSTNENQKRRLEKTLVPSTRARVGVSRLSTMTYESKPNSSYDRSTETDRRDRVVSGGAA